MTDDDVEDPFAFDADTVEFAASIRPQGDEQPMLTREAWFKARRADGGTGYSLTHWKGGVAVCAMLLWLLRNSARDWNG